MVFLCKFGQNQLIGSGDKSAAKAHFTVFIVWWPWKLGQGHRNLNQSLKHPNITIYEVWLESVIWFKRYGHIMVHTSFYFWSKFKKFTVFIEWWPWKLGQCHQNLLTNLKISKCWCDLENEFKVTKIYSLLCPSQQCVCASLVKIHAFVQEIECIGVRRFSCVT